MDIWYNPCTLQVTCGNLADCNWNSVTGPSATEFLEWLTPSSLTALDNFQSTLSVLLNERGGIIDDTVICKHASDRFYVVTNAGRRAEDLAWLEQKRDEWNSSGKPKVELEVLEGWGLVALQGKTNEPDSA